MNERDKLIAQLIKDKGGSREDYLNLINRFEYHETGGTFDTQIEAKKIKGHAKASGAVGILQYKRGKNEGGITAARRLKQYYDSIGTKPEPWLTKALEKDYLDVRDLSRDQQETLFLGDMRMHPKADFSKVWRGEESPKDFWLNYHWAGKNKYRKQRGASFDDSMKRYNDEYGDYNYGGGSTTLPAPKEKVSAPNKSKPEYRKQVVDYVNYLDAKEQWAPKDQNQMEMGGSTGTSLLDRTATMFNVPLTHNQHPMGGYPLGVGPNGKPNTVEGGEAAFNIKNSQNKPFLKTGKFIFHNQKTLK